MRVALFLSIAAMLSGCRFWYKPVKVADAIGEATTVVAGDSVHVHREPRFEVYGPAPEAVYDGYEQLNRTYRNWERHMSAPGPRLAVLLAGDTAVPLDVGTLRGFRDRGLTVVRYMRPESFRSPSRYGALGYGGVVWPIGPTAARVMLARFADAQLGGASPIASAAGDSLLLARFPVWFRAAVMHLVGEGGLPANDLEYAREKRAQLMPLRELLTLVRPVAQDSLLDPSRRGDADDLTRLIGAQSSTFARYLVEREGPPVLGRLARGYLAGRSLNEMIDEFTVAPHSIEELEQRWKYWLATRED